MNDPKDAPEQSLSGAQKQGDVSSEGKAQAPGPARSDANSTRSGVPARKAAPPLSDAAPDDDADPMARLTEIVSGASAQQALTAGRMPEQDAAPIPSQTVSSQAVPPQAVPLQQPGAPALPPVVAVPQVEIAAEDRPAAPPPRPEGVAGGRFSGMFRRKRTADQAAAAMTPTEPQSLPAKKGGWLRRRDGGAQQRQAAHHHRTAREKHWLRRRRRVWLEELLGWIFVPLILIGIYWGVMGLLAMLGTTPEAMISGFKTILGHF